MTPRDKQRTGTAEAGPALPEPAHLRRMYSCMLLMREFERSIDRLFQQGKFTGAAYSGLGNEATAVGSAAALADSDYLFPLHRDLGAHFMRGQTPERIAKQYLAHADGMTRGRDGTGHYADARLRIYGNISHLGAMVPVAAGVALSCRLRRGDTVVMTYIGDGGSNVGEVHEGLAMASAMKLPLILIIENNQFAYSTPVAKQSRAERLSDRAAGYGIPGITIDGTDVLAVYRTCREAADRARKGGGPSIIESVTMRMAGHAAHDTAWYVPKALLEEWKKKDPVERFARFLIDRKIESRERLDAILAGVRSDVDSAIAGALAGAFPAGPEAAEGVYSE